MYLNIPRGTDYLEEFRFQTSIKFLFRLTIHICFALYQNFIQILIAEQWKLGKNLQFLFKQNINKLLYR